MLSQIVVTTAAETVLLTTLARVKAEIDITTDATDDLLTAKIAEASSDIAIRVFPTLRRETISETLRPEVDRYGCGGSYGPSLSLSRYPLADVSSVMLDGVAVDAAEYWHGDLSSELGGSGRLYRLDASGNPASWCFSKSAVIAYSAGFLLPGQGGRNLPPSLESAAVDLIASYWLSRGRDGTVKSVDIPDVRRVEYWVGAVGSSVDLPPGVMAKIEPFRMGMWV